VSKVRVYLCVAHEGALFQRKARGFAQILDYAYKNWPFNTLTYFAALSLPKKESFKAPTPRANVMRLFTFVIIECSL
jgi:hypothetical protein